MFLEIHGISDSLNFLYFACLGELLGLLLQSGACFSGSDTSRKTFFSYDCSKCMVFYSRIKRTCSNCMVFYSRIERATNTAPRNARRASVAFCRPGRLPGELQRFRPPTSYLRCPTSHSLLPTSSFLLPSSDFLLPTSCFPLPASLLPTSCFPLPTSKGGRCSAAGVINPATLRRAVFS